MGAALNMEESGQIVLIKMHELIPEMQVKFPIKISHHGVLDGAVITILEEM